MNANFFIKRFTCVVMSLLCYLNVLSPAGYATDANYDRSSESLQKVLSLYGKTVRDIKNSTYVYDPSIVETESASRASYTVETETVRLTFDDNLVVELVNNKVDSFSNFTTITGTATYVSEHNDLSDVIDSVTEIAELGAEYQIIHSLEFDEDYWRIAWAKKYGELLNTYEAVNVVVNRHTGEIVTYKRFDTTPNTLAPEISEADALSAISSLLEENDIDTNSVDGVLTFTQPNYFPDTSSTLLSVDEVRLSYMFELFDSSIRIFVDAVTGSVIGYTESRDTARAFSIVEMDGDFYEPYGQTSAATSCFASLGYNTMSPYYAEQSTYLKTVIMSFLSRSDAYGFYLACHGTSQESGSPVLYDTDRIWTITPNEISGNWKFVFLDGCFTGQSSIWASAFNIYNTSSNRAFLGWDQVVYGRYVIPFSYFLFDEIVDQAHSDNIRDAAVWAANQIENDPLHPNYPTTPIRFIGDRTYDGRI